MMNNSLNSRTFMRCAIISRAGQVLARGQLILTPIEDGAWRLDLQTDGGRHVQGGPVGEDGSMTAASQVLFDQFFDVWGMSNLTLNVTLR
ncbi:hypothetical protein [Spirulina subsalsa]|jgi:hypothetical protein|uniref:hypothetical protein n=2 Tax=Spirulinaceae TaxID=1890448 RepID=UPI00232B2BA5|nr:hypothetical protein [Spirulina subsalsa]